MKSLSTTNAGSIGLYLRRGDVRLGLLLAVVMLLFAAQGLAQEATFVGTVMDPSGAAVANAKVTLTNLDTNATKVLNTNDSGQFTAVDIHIGHYNIQVEMNGFKTAEKKGLVLQVGDRMRVDFQLQVGGSAETVSVEANALTVQSDTGEVSNVIDGSQIEGLSVNGRGIYQLAALAPGASSQIDVTAPNTPVGGSAGVEFNGLRQNHNIYLLDGGENDDRGGAGGMSIAPSLDSIAEFRQLTSNYSADYGLSSAGTMTLVLKSGTKDFHAAAWEFNRNDAFDARTYNNRPPNPVAELRQNTFGFNVGGPVTFGKLYNPEKNKTFFFYNMEWRKYINGQTLQQTVPLTSWYGGAFGSSFNNTTLHTPCTTQLGVGTATPNTALINAFAAAGQTLSTPNSADGSCTADSTLPTPGSNLVAFTNNTIPTSLLSPNAQALLTAGGAYGGIFPAPNSGNNFIGGANSPTNLREEIVRIDHNFTSKFSVFGHFVDESVQQTFGTSLWNWSNTPVQGTSFGNPSYSGVIHTTYAIKPTLLNEVAFNYNGNRINIIPTGLISAPSGFNFSRIFTGPNSDNRIPNIHLAGSTGTQFGNNSWPWTNKADDYQIRDDLSWTRGAHQFKFGGSWAIYKKYQQLFGNTQGDFTFNGAYTGLDFADYLLGLSNAYGELGVQDYGRWNNVSWAMYFQDNWRVNKRLTLNLGLRWDGVPHTYEASNRMGNFYPNLYDPAKAALLDSNGNICSGPANAVAGTNPGCSAASPGLGGSPNPILKAAGTQFYLNGIGIPGTTPGVPKGLVNTNWAAFGPRLGFAYDLTGSGKTIVRGGFGAMYERIQGNDMYNAGPNIPFSTNVTFNNVSLDKAETFTNTGLTAVAPITVASITGLAVNHYKLPVAYQYSVGVQHALANRTILAVMYVGNQSRQQNYYQNINLPDPSTLPGLIGGTLQYNNVVPYKGFNALSMSTDGANAHYNGLQVDLNSQIKRDLSLRVFYTLSRSIDPSNQTNGGGGGGDLVAISNPYAGWQYDVGRSGYDRLHNFSANFIYSLPFLRNSTNGFLRSVVGGWEFSGIVTIESGLPLNVTISGPQGGNGLPSATNRPDKVGALVAPHTKDQWMTDSAFALPAVGAWGNLGYDAIDGPGRDNWNLSLFKSFLFNEARGSQFELRLETFNTFNHPQIQSVPTGFGSSNFGQPNGFFPGRIVQLGGKISF
ncbi:MAG TPA: TonB-dependent receptor [Candidatus Sulfotelmatobacter sp.]|nr:TonB-dependent receptor [Candidatus Sulfotelmatobacter sp.]